MIQDVGSGYNPLDRVHGSSRTGRISLDGSMPRHDGKRSRGKNGEETDRVAPDGIERDPATAGSSAPSRSGTAAASGTTSGSTGNPANATSAARGGRGNTVGRVPDQRQAEIERRTDQTEVTQ